MIELGCMNIQTLKTAHKMEIMCQKMKYSLLKAPTGIVTCEVSYSHSGTAEDITPRQPVNGYRTFNRTYRLQNVNSRLPVDGV